MHHNFPRTQENLARHAAGEEVSFPTGQFLGLVMQQNGISEQKMAFKLTGGNVRKLRSSLQGNYLPGEMLPKVATLTGQSEDFWRQPNISGALAKGITIDMSMNTNIASPDTTALPKIWAESRARTSIKPEDINVAHAVHDAEILER